MSNTMPTHFWGIGDYAFYPEKQILIKQGKTEEYQQKISSAEALILDHLLKNHDELCKKDILVNTGWQGRPISIQALPVAIATLRKYLSAIDNAVEIKNISRKGYILISRTAIYQAQDDAFIPRQEPDNIPLPVQEEPSCLKRKNGLAFLSTWPVLALVFSVFTVLALIVFRTWIPVTCHSSGKGEICAVDDGPTQRHTPIMAGENQVIGLSGSRAVIVDLQGEKE